jgi:glycosyltransferase involved in cell wall biosynthesis
MRILYLLRNRQKSITEFTNLKINLPWVDVLLNELSKSERVTVALCVPVDNQYIQKSKKNGILVFGLPEPSEKNILIKVYKRITRSLTNIKINSYISQVVSDFNPDIIQIFGSENSFGLIAKQLNIPVIIHIQGYSFVCLGKWFSGISKWEQFRYTGLKNLLLMRGNYHEYFNFRKRGELETHIIKNCRYFLGRTNFDKGIISLISPDSKYFHCDEFIRKDFFEKQWDVPLNNVIKCVSILKGTSYKGLDLLIETLYILKKYSSFVFNFKVCGVSANEEVVRLLKKKYKKEFRLIEIDFLGNMASEELVKQLCNSNFYVHPSYVENSPNSICEAMSLGMPIISTNVGGVNSMIEDKVEGILVQEGEPYSLAGAIVDLANNYEKAKELGHNARNKAFIRHNPQSIQSKLLEIYEKIIQEDGRKVLP